MDRIHPDDREDISVPDGSQNPLLPQFPAKNDDGLTIISDTAWVQNILLIGTDAATPGMSCRSDAMILISLNREHKKIVACSILRDILVKIEGYEQNRLNAAYSFGGFDLLQKTLKEQLNLDIVSYVMVDFSSFIQIIDLLGGVDLAVTSEEAEFINAMCEKQYSGIAQIPLQDGVCRLNGRQALAYSRDRSSANGDFDRTKRQQKLIDALMQKMKQASPLELLRLFYQILPNVTTNIPEDRLTILTSDLTEYLNYQTVFTTIPQKGTFLFTTVRGMAVIDMDFKANIRYLSEQIY